MTGVFGQIARNIPALLASQTEPEPKARAQKKPPSLFRNPQRTFNRLTA